MPPSESEVLRYAPPRGLRLAAVAAVILVAVVVTVGVLSRVHANQSLKAASADQTITAVELVQARLEKAAQDLVLPADVQALQSAAIHARVSGYLKWWGPDIGARVRRGQLLAELDTPDLDQQLAQARADLNTARANQTLSRSTEARWKALLAQDAVSQQEYDEKAGDLAAKTSLVKAAAANVGRLEATAAFRRVTAPFDGVVTQRATNVGDLVSAAAGEALYTIADVRRLRVYVRVPQQYTPQLRPGMAVALHAPERPNQTFMASVVNDAEAINAQSGALLVQLQVDNTGGVLRPGEYLQARFDLPAPAEVVTLPATALIYRANGPQVAVVDSEGRVRLRRVALGRDLGAKVQITSGLGARDKVIDNPPDALADGDRVRVVSPAAAHG